MRGDRNRRFHHLVVIDGKPAGVVIVPEGPRFQRYAFIDRDGVDIVKASVQGVAAVQGVEDHGPAGGAAQGYLGAIVQRAAGMAGHGGGGRSGHLIAGGEAFAHIVAGNPGDRLQQQSAVLRNADGGAVNRALISGLGTVGGIIYNSVGAGVGKLHLNRLLVDAGGRLRDRQRGLIPNQHPGRHGGLVGRAQRPEADQGIEHPAVGMGVRIVDGINMGANPFEFVKPPERIAALHGCIKIHVHCAMTPSIIITYIIFFIHYSWVAYCIIIPVAVRIPVYPVMRIIRLDLEFVHMVDGEAASC